MQIVDIDELFNEAEKWIESSLQVNIIKDVKTPFPNDCYTLKNFLDDFRNVVKQNYVILKGE